MFVTKDTPPFVASLIAELGESLYEFNNSKKNPMDKALTLWRELTVALSGAETMKASFPIVAATSACLDRLASRITNQVVARSQELLGSVDLKETIQTLTKEMTVTSKLPDAVSDILHSLRVCTSLQPEVTDEKEIPASQDALEPLLPHVVKLHHLQKEYLASVMPETWGKIEKFLTKYQKSLTTFLQSIETSLQKPMADLDKFRPGFCFQLILRQTFCYVCPPIYFLLGCECKCILPMASF